MMPSPRFHALVTAELTGEARIRLAAVVALTDGDAPRRGRPMGENELIAALAGKEILVVGYEQVTAAVIGGSPDLRLIASIRGGPEANIAIGAATARGIPVLYTTGRNARAVAEHTLGLMLALARHIPRADALVREHVLTHDAVDTPTTDVLWRLPPCSPAARAHETLIGSELFGKTLGIVGCGAVGRLVACFGEAFGMRVLVHDPFITDAMGNSGEKAPFAAVLADSDYLTLHARLTPRSAGMIGAAELAGMKPTACLINTARADLVGERALIEALQMRRIAGAALDVFHREPLPPDYPLIGLDHVILTPHLAGWTREVPTHHSEIVARDLLRFLAGDLPHEHLANPTVLAQPAFAERGGRLLGALAGPV
jgi:D-3-phosphoglycerate dehydrogenase